MTPIDLRALLGRAKMTQKEGAALCGVTLRQFQNWAAGSSPIPILAENALIAEEGARADLAFERECSEPQNTDVRAVLESIAADQARHIATLEVALESVRAALNETYARISDL